MGFKLHQTLVVIGVFVGLLTVGAGVSLTLACSWDSLSPIVNCDAFSSLDVRALPYHLHLVSLCLIIVSWSSVFLRKEM